MTTSTTHSNSPMGDQNIGRLLLKFSIPAIVGTVVNALYHTVDRIFVGHGVGSIGIAATTVAFPIMTILMGISMLIGIGATSLISIRLGQEKHEEAEKVVGNAIVLLVLLPVLLTIMYLIFSDPILIFFGASNEVLPYARDFVHIVMLGSAFGATSMGVNNFIRAEGNPRLAMLTQIIGALINVVLNYIFIFKLGLGIKGSALATISAQFVSALWVFSYYWTGRSIVKIRLKNMKLSMPIVFSIMAIGFAPFAMMLANCVKQTILNKSLLFYGGDLALSAIGIIMSIAAMMFMPIVGLSQGAQPIIGFNYGAKLYSRVIETLKLAVIAGSCIALLGYAVIYTWPTQIVSLFSKDTFLIEITTQAIRIYFALFLVVGFQIICSNYFQAVGKPIQSTILGLSRQVLLFIPMLLILPNYWGINGIWMSAPISDALSVLLTATVIYIEIKNLANKQAKTVSFKQHV
jgi:putative MATE family efflux protein